MPLSDLGTAIARRMEPEMQVRGFGHGGPGWSPDGSHTFLWCIGGEDLERRWPATAAALRTWGDITPHPGACVDLTVECDADGRLDRFDLEMAPVDELLDRVGRPDLAGQSSVGALEGLAPDDAVDRLLRAVEALLPVGQWARR